MPSDGRWDLTRRLKD